MRNGTNKFPFSAALSQYGEARKWMRSPVSRQSWYALDCLNFLVGSVQIGLGTFVAFYLASLGWSKESVGLALASGQVAGVLGQIPGGAITDAITWKRGFAALGILMSMGRCSDLCSGAAGYACLCCGNARRPYGGYCPACNRSNQS